MFVEILTPIGNAFSNINNQFESSNRSDERNFQQAELHRMKKAEMTARMQYEQQRVEEIKQRSEDKHNLALQQQTLNSQRIEKNYMYLTSKRQGFELNRVANENAIHQGGIGVQLPPQ